MTTYMINITTILPSSRVSPTIAVAWQLSLPRNCLRVAAVWRQLNSDQTRVSSREEQVGAGGGDGSKSVVATNERCVALVLSISSVYLLPPQPLRIREFMLTLERTHRDYTHKISKDTA